MLKKFYYSILAITLLNTSCVRILSNSVFSTVEPWKEWEIKLSLNYDSTFKLSDKFGCNIFSYEGRWSCHIENTKSYLLLSDTMKVEYIKSHNMYQFYNTSTKNLQAVKADIYFPIIKFDTVWILNERQLNFRGLIFNRSSENKDLSNVRVKMIEEFYVNKIGKELFIKNFGNGQGIRAARKYIKECKNQPIPNLELINK